MQVGDFHDIDHDAFCRGPNNADLVSTNAAQAATDAVSLLSLPSMSIWSSAMAIACIIAIHRLQCAPTQKKLLNQVLTSRLSHKRLSTAQSLTLLLVLCVVLPLAQARGVAERGGGGNSTVLRGLSQGRGCAANLQCTSKQCTCYKCAASNGKHADNVRGCSSGANCASGYCDGTACVGVCKAKKGQGSACGSNTACSSNKCVCGKCAASNGKHANNVRGCSSGANCASGYCDGTGCVGMCKAKVGQNSACGSNTACSSNKCVCGKCAAGSGKHNDGRTCSLNSECSSNWCFGVNIPNACRGQCKAKLPQNSDCADNGISHNDRCASNKCVCGKCADNSGDHQEGRSCKEETECGAGLVCWNGNGLTCSGTCGLKKSEGQSCRDNLGFDHDNWCEHNKCACGKCTGSNGKHGTGKTCTQQSQCTSGWCFGMVLGLLCQGSCREPYEDGEECGTGVFTPDERCKSGKCQAFVFSGGPFPDGKAYCRPAGGFGVDGPCLIDSDCAGALKCDKHFLNVLGTGKCTFRKETGEACGSPPVPSWASNADDECADTRQCKCYTCTDPQGKLAANDPCNDDGDCLSGVCSGLNSALGPCTGKCLACPASAPITYNPPITGSVSGLPSQQAVYGPHGTGAWEDLYREDDPSQRDNQAIGDLGVNLPDLEAAWTTYIGQCHDLRRDGGGILIIKHGRIVFEKYTGSFTKETRSPLMSLTKLFSATVFAFAEREGFVSLDDKPYNLLPPIAGPSPVGLTNPIPQHCTATTCQERKCFPPERQHRLCHKDSTFRDVLQKRGEKNKRNAGNNEGDLYDMFGDRCLSTTMDAIHLRSQEGNAYNFMSKYLHGKMGMTIEWVNQRCPDGVVCSDSHAFSGCICESFLPPLLGATLGIAGQFLGSLFTYLIGCSFELTAELVSMNLDSLSSCTINLKFWNPYAPQPPHLPYGVGAEADHRDVAKIGQLWLNRGRWLNGDGTYEQLMNTDFVREGLDPSAAETGGAEGWDYGFQWSKRYGFDICPDRVFPAGINSKCMVGPSYESPVRNDWQNVRVAFGLLGQALVIDPVNDIVIVSLAGKQSLLTNHFVTSVVSTAATSYKEVNDLWPSFAPHLETPPTNLGGAATSWNCIGSWDMCSSGCTQTYTITRDKGVPSIVHTHMHPHPLCLSSA